MSTRGANHYMSKRNLTFDFLKDMPSRSPPSKENLAKREALKAEIAGMQLYGLTTEAERAAIRERIRGRGRWQPVSGAKRGTGGMLA